MTYQEQHPMGGTESDSPDHLRIVAEGGKVDFTPEWLMEWEKEQDDKMVVLRRQVQAKRDYVFAESMYGRRERQLQFQASVRAYDAVLNLIDGVKE